MSSKRKAADADLGPPTIIADRKRQLNDQYYNTLLAVRTSELENACDKDEVGGYSDGDQSFVTDRQPRRRCCALCSSTGERCKNYVKDRDRLNPYSNKMVKSRFCHIHSQLCLSNVWSQFKHEEDKWIGGLRESAVGVNDKLSYPRRGGNRVTQVGRFKVELKKEVLDYYRNFHHRSWPIPIYSYDVLEFIFSYFYLGLDVFMRSKQKELCYKGCSDENHEAELNFRRLMLDVMNDLAGFDISKFQSNTEYLAYLEQFEMLRVNSNPANFTLSMVKYDGPDSNLKKMSTVAKIVREYHQMVNRPLKDAKY